MPQPPSAAAPPPVDVLPSGLPPISLHGSAEVISDASRQVRALAMLSGSLTDPLSPEDAADVVERQALAVLGATSAVVVTLGEFPPVSPMDSSVSLDAKAVANATNGSAPAPERLTLVHAIGLTTHVDAWLRELRLEAVVPLAEVARTGEPVFLGSESEMKRYPIWSEALLLSGSRAAAAVPVWANGHLRGVLGLSWTTAHAFDEDERAFVVTLGVMCAQAIMRGHLKAAEQKARVSAEHANLAKTQFLRTISHELRTPLTAVLGNTELLSEEIVGSVTPVQKDHLRRIRRSSDHLLSLIEELLQFAQLDAGAEVVQAEPLLITDVVDETLDMLAPIAKRRGIRIHFDRPEAPIALETDRLKLRQILVNLVTNAVKYSDAGQITISVERSGVAGAIVVSCEVTDTGIGIAAADHEHIFDAFWQAQQSLTRPSGGTGLGLSVARQLARLLGGDVELRSSELGRGSTFVVWLPERHLASLPREIVAA